MDLESTLDIAATLMAEALVDSEVQHTLAVVHGVVGSRLQRRV